MTKKIEHIDVDYIIRHGPEPSEMIDVSTHSDKPESVFIESVKKPLYLPAMWSGVIPTFKCETCGHCDPDKDEMILHVITHVPERDRDELLEKLTKE